MLGLRERGLVIEVASVNPPDRLRKDLPPGEAAEADQTFYVKPNNLMRAPIEILLIVLRHPLVTLRGLTSALRLGGWDLKRRVLALFYLGEALLVGQWMLRRSLTHLHVHFGGPVASVGMLTAKAWRLPWSLTLHGPDEFFDQEAFWLRQKIESAGFVICIGDYCRSQVLRIAPHLEDRRIEVVRLGVDCNELRPTKSAPESDFVNDPGSGQSGCLKLVCTGRLVAAKGHRILLEALAMLRSRGQDFTCTLIGDGQERRALESLAAHLGIKEQVKFMGAMAHQSTLSLVSEADVFVLASFAEGLPIALMEAMAMGIPCVSTPIAAIPELIKNGENGLLTAPSNSLDLCLALERLAKSADLRRQLGKNARAEVEDRYNLSSNLDRLAETWARRLEGEF